MTVLFGVLLMLGVFALLYLAIWGYSALVDPGAHDWSKWKRLWRR